MPAKTSTDLAVSFEYYAAIIKLLEDNNYQLEACDDSEESGHLGLPRIDIQGAGIHLILKDALNVTVTLEDAIPNDDGWSDETRTYELLDPHSLTNLLKAIQTFIELKAKIQDCYTQIGTIQ